MVDEQAGPGLYVKIGLNTSELIGNIGGISLALNQSLEVFSKFEQGARQVLQLAVDAGRFGKEIKDNARDIGMSVQEYQQWTHVAIAAGSNQEELTSAVRMFTVRMKEARDPTSEMSKMLKSLGVSALDSNGGLRSTNDILLDLFPALNNTAAGFDRNQASTVLFGRNISNVADLASLTRTEIDDLISQAPVFSDEKIAKLDDFNTKLALTNEKMEIMKVNMGEKLVPVINDSVFPALESLAPLMDYLIVRLDYFVEDIDKLATGASMIADPLNWEKYASGLNTRQSVREQLRSGVGDASTWAKKDTNTAIIPSGSGGKGTTTLYFTVQNPAGTIEQEKAAALSFSRIVARGV